MATDDLKNLLLWFAALAAGIAISAAPLLFPDARRIILWTCFLGGVGVAALLVAIVIFVAIRDGRTGKGFSRRLFTLMVATGLGAILFMALFLWPRDAFSQSMPGFSNYSVLRIYDTPEFKRKYLFQFQTSEGSKVAFFISASDNFTFAVTDTHGETYSIEIPIDSGKIPLDRPIILFSEVGLTENSTLLRVVVDGHEVVRRTLPFAIDLGSLKWNAGTLGGVPLRLMEVGNYPKALTNDEVSKLSENVRQYYKRPFDNR